MATDHRNRIVGNPMTSHGGHVPTPRVTRTMTEIALGIKPVTTTASGRSTHEWASKEAKAIMRAYKILDADKGPVSHEGMMVYTDADTGAVHTMHPNEWRLAAGPEDNPSKFYRSRADIYEIPASNQDESRRY